MTPPITRFEIDLGAIAANVGAIRRSLARAIWLCAALKSDAYGFGLLPVARTVVDAGADALGVGSTGDGIRLRDAGINKPVLVYGGDLLTESAVGDLESHDLIATVHDAGSLRACMRSARRRLKVMIEVDVGLNRLGFDSAGVAEAVAAIRASRRLDLQGLYTHMRVPADGDTRRLRSQFAKFKAALSAAGPVPIAMAASSRVLDLAPDMALEAVDVGRAIYGLMPRDGGHLGPRLRPAFVRIRSCLIAVKALAPEDRGQELRGVARLGVIPFGRAGGMADLGVGKVLIGGAPAPVVGQPSLEHTRIDLSRHPKAQVGAEVIIVGRQGRKVIGLDEVLRAHPDLPDLAVALRVGGSVLRVYERGRAVDSPATPFKESRDQGAARTAARRRRPSPPDRRSPAGDAC